MRAYLEDKLEYDMACNLDWSRHICFYEDEITGEIKKEMSHIINFHHRLNQQILGEELESELWDTFSIYDFEALHHDNYQRTLTLLEKEQTYFTIEDTLGYYNKFLLEDLVFELIQHSAQHRAKLALMFKNLQIHPKSHSYLLYKRAL